jgi:hypothetical protein
MADALEGRFAGTHIAKLDALQDLVHSHAFRAICKSLPELVLDRVSPSVLHVISGPATVLVIPLPEHEAPDPRPRLKATCGEITYADHTVDGMRMAIFGMLMQANANAEAPK